MMDDETPPATRRMLERIAATLNLPASYFFNADIGSANPDRPTVIQCDEVSTLFRAIRSPTRRGAVLELLREMARQSRH
ncbi:hypothetical protein [Methylobacterium sp. NEAU K]|uniref:hypothetical protein n=1 Tax=Methylobacterium sp. NEAU K TaxID=3064946 RepID=UPI002737544F|nr:hypothetical protein [Methylobacterium sp. NEAU K]MDP4002343.1 hypothetical protein [Methylobacterium sp. NEAU K]